MPRRNRGLAVRTTPIREVTLVIAVILWIVGFMATILGVLDLPGNWGVWLLAISGALLILASLVEGL